LGMAVGVRYGIVWMGKTWHGSYGMGWQSIVRFGMVWVTLVQFASICFNLVQIGFGGFKCFH